MSPAPKQKRMTRERAPGGDRTSAVVAAGLVFLAVMGVATVFSAPIMALVAAPSPEENPLAEPTEHAPRVPAGVPTAVAVRDGGTHS